MNEDEGGHQAASIRASVAPRAAPPGERLEHEQEHDSAGDREQERAKVPGRTDVVPEGEVADEIEHRPSNHGR